MKILNLTYRGFTFKWQDDGYQQDGNERNGKTSVIVQQKNRDDPPRLNAPGDSSGLPIALRFRTCQRVSANRKRKIPNIIVDPEVCLAIIEF